MYINFIKNKIKGISLIESIIYLAIFSAMSVVVINSFIVILSSLSTINLNHDLISSGSTSIERISREIRQAKNIDLANTTSDTLQLNSTDSFGNDMIIKFLKEENALNIYKDGVLLDNLLTKDVILEDILFDRISTTNSEAVKVKMTIKETRKNKTKSVIFYDTIILRGGIN